jgi:hypothetical protein
MSQQSKSQSINNLSIELPPYLRLTRWGEFAGFSEEPTGKPPKGNELLVAQLLLLIERHFEDAAKVVQALAVGDDIATAS